MTLSNVSVSAPMTSVVVATQLLAELPRHSLQLVGPSSSSTAPTSENVPRNPTLSQILKQHSRRVFGFDEEELALDRKHL